MYLPCKFCKKTGYKNYVHPSYLGCICFDCDQERNKIKAKNRYREKKGIPLAFDKFMIYT